MNSLLLFLEMLNNLTGIVQLVVLVLQLFGIFI